MSSINMNKALLEMQRMAASAQMQPAQAGSKPSEGQSFTDLLKDAVNNVNDLQKEAGDLKKAFEVGDPNVDLPQVMVAAQKSSIAFQAMLKVRNDLMKAYQDVMNIHV